MKTITKQINVYQFDELNEKAKNKIRSEVSDFILLDFFEEDCINNLKESGFIDPKLFYSLSYSQGDGVSFTCKSIDFEILIAKHNLCKEYLKYEWYGAINKISNYYSHKNTVKVDVECYNTIITTDISKLINVLEQEINKIKNDLCDNFEKNGYAEIEYQTSDESIKEREEWYDENGKVVVI